MDETPHLVGHLKRFPDDLQTLLGEADPIDKGIANSENGNQIHGGVPLIDAVSRRMFQLYAVPSGGVKVLIRDLDTLQKVDVRAVPEIASLDSFLPGTRRGLPAAVDSAGKRIFLWVNQWPGQNVSVAQRRGVVVMDWDAPTGEDGKAWYRFNPVFPDGGTYAFNSQTPAFEGLTYVPSEHKLYVRLQESNDVASSVSKLDLLQLSAPESAGGLSVSTDWSRWVRSCRSQDEPSSGNAQASGWYPIVWKADERAIYVPCSGSGAAAVVVDLPVSDQGLPLNEQVFVGGGNAKQWIADVGGLRLHAEVGSAFGPAILTFDVEHKAFVGLTAVGDGAANLENASPLGLDQSSGRVYALGQAPRFGLTVIDSRLTPVPPGARYPQFPGFTAPVSAPYLPIIFVPPASAQGVRRFLVPDADTQQPGDVPPLPTDRPARDGGGYNIFDDQPPLLQPEVPDPDRSTRDIPENEGVTTHATYTAGASGYGSRILLPGGVRGVIGVPVINDGTWPPKSPCWVSGRELILGRVDESFLSSDLGRSAKAVSALADETTKPDLNAPSRCDETAVTDVVRSAPNGGAVMDNFWMAIDEHGQDWPFREVDCDGTTKANDVDTFDEGLADFTSTVDCFPGQARITASALSETLKLPGDVSVAASGIATVVAPGLDGGVVSKAIAFARGIDVGGQIKIDGVYAYAESQATGRPESSNNIGARTKYVRSIVGFSSPGFSCGHEEEESCDKGGAQEFADGVNKGLAGNVQINFPPLDNGMAGGPKLEDGTDGGYQAAVQRDTFDALNAEFSNGDSLREVPGVEIIRYNDGRGAGRQRQIFQFAGVLSNSQYGILPLSEPAPSSSPTPTASPSNSPRPRESSSPTSSGDNSGGAGPITTPAPSASAVGITSRGEEFAPLAQANGVTPARPVIQPPPSSGGGIPGVVRQVARAWRVLFSSPKRAGLLAAVWALLLLPFALAHRRYLLLQAKGTLTGDGR